MKTEVVLKYNLNFLKLISLAFNENRGCIEMFGFTKEQILHLGLMKTEVVLKLPILPANSLNPLGLMKTEVVLKLEIPPIFLVLWLV